MKTKITVDKAESLKNKLTKSNELYEQYNQMEVQPGTEDINQKYKGLVALRKNLSYPANPPIQEIIDF